MIQKEIIIAKKKAKECLDIFDIKVPMVKMHVLFFYIYKDGFFISFFDVRTHDYYTCDCENNDYGLTVNVKDTGETHILREIKGVKSND